MENEKVELSASEIEDLVRIMNLKYGPYLKGRLFQIELNVDNDILCAEVVLKNSDKTFYYPVKSRIFLTEQKLSEREAAMLLLDFSDSYFEEFLKGDEGVYFPIEWTDYSYEGASFQVQGQILNSKAEDMADALLAQSAPQL